MSQEKIGVIGSGLMGTGIAFVVASRTEAETIVLDVAEEFLKKSRAAIEGFAARAVEKGQAKQDEAGAWLKRLRFTTNGRGADRIVTTSTRKARPPFAHSSGILMTDKTLGSGRETIPKDESGGAELVGAARMMTREAP